MDKLPEHQTVPFSEQYANMFIVVEADAVIVAGPVILTRTRASTTLPVVDVVAAAELATAVKLLAKLLKEAQVRVFEPE